MNVSYEMPQWFDMDNYDDSDLTDKQVLWEVRRRDFIISTLDDELKMVGSIDNMQEALTGLYDSWKAIELGNPFDSNFDKSQEWDDGKVRRGGVIFNADLVNEITMLESKASSKIWLGGEYDTHHSISRKNLFNFSDPRQFSAKSRYFVSVDIEMYTDQELLENFKNILSEIRLAANKPEVDRKEEPPKFCKDIRVMKIIPLIDLVISEYFNQPIANHVIACAIHGDKVTTNSHEKISKLRSRLNTHFLPKSHQYR
jgi:hypothetical protein